MRALLAARVCGRVGGAWGPHLMGLAQQLGMCLGKMGIHPTSLCPHGEVHSEPWKLHTSIPLDAEGLGFFSSEVICSSPCLLHGEQGRAGECVASLWAHALDSFTDSEAQVANSLLPKPSPVYGSQKNQEDPPPRKGLPVKGKAVPGSVWLLWRDSVAGGG